MRGEKGLRCRELRTTVGMGKRSSPPHHLLQDIVGEEAILDIGYLHIHGDAIVIGPLLEDGASWGGVTPQHWSQPHPNPPWGQHPFTSGGGITQKGAILDSTPGFPW